MVVIFSAPASVRAAGVRMLQQVDPDFATLIELKSGSDAVAPLRVDVWDDDSGGKKDPKKRDLIGRATFTKFALTEAALTKARAACAECV